MGYGLWWSLDDDEFGGNNRQQAIPSLDHVPGSSADGGWEAINPAFEWSWNENSFNHFASTGRNSAFDLEFRMLYLPNWDSSGSCNSKSCRFSAVAALSSGKE